MRNIRFAASSEYRIGKIILKTKVVNTKEYFYSTVQLEPNFGDIEYSSANTTVVFLTLWTSALSLTKIVRLYIVQTFF